MFRNFLYLIAIISLFSTVYGLSNSASYANTPPKPSKKAESLSVLQDRLATEKTNKKKLEKELKSLEKHLSGTKNKLIKTASNIRANETALTDLERKIDILEAEELSLQKSIEDNYGTISDLIMALQRMRRLPPEAILAKPGAPLKTAQTAMLLENTLPSVKTQAETLSGELQRLNLIESELLENKNNVLAKRTELSKQQNILENLMNDREDLLAKTQTDIKRSSDNIQKTAKEAKNLQDLMAKLAAEEKRRAAQAQNQKSVISNLKNIPDLGKGQLPVSGLLITRFGQKDHIGATSQGLTIQTQPGAIAVAPMGGVIQFAGEFKNFGRMIIIKHKKNYHSLVAGLDKINTKVGRHVDAGEPVGILPSASSRGGPPTLYYELRLKERPVNPSTKFSDLKS